MSLKALRSEYHKTICRDILCIKDGIPNFADKGSKSSKNISKNLMKRLDYPPCPTLPKEQTVGARFSLHTMDFLRKSFALLQHLRPGDWKFSASQASLGIAIFDQYEHLAALSALIEKIKNDPSLSTALSGDYLIIPDIVVGREPVKDSLINKGKILIKEKDKVSNLTPLRASNRLNSKQILHASISCKWTIRSDRAQNTRTEALNLIRNRKGRTPHIIAVTAEPLPTRLAALAVGTGDIDCVYHMALHELVEAVAETKNSDQIEELTLLIDGRRLRDISDLPFDLAT